MLEVIREDGETIDKLLRRYSDKLKRTNFFTKVKGRQAFSKKLNKRARKVSAIYKFNKKQKMDYLKRIGKIEERTVWQGNKSLRYNRGKKI
jgi:ribosomal protein S21